MASKIKLNPGDVFDIPIDPQRIGFGQVVMKPEKTVLFIVVFSAIAPTGAVVNVDSIVHSKIVLAGNTFDAKFVHGHWQVIGNITSNLVGIGLPKYKSGMGNHTVIETLDRSRNRRATADEEAYLPLRTYTAPVGFEMAIKAFHGVGGWQHVYDDLEYDHLRRSSSVVL